MSQKKRLMNEQPKRKYAYASKETLLAVKILFIVISVITVGLLTWYGIDVLIMNHEPNYFFVHFLACVCLIAVGIIALVMPILNKKNLKGENKGDQLMQVVAVLAFLFAILSVIISYVNF